MDTFKAEPFFIKSLLSALTAAAIAAALAIFGTATPGLREAAAMVLFRALAVFAMTHGFVI